MFNSKLKNGEIQIISAIPQQLSQRNNPYWMTFTFFGLINNSPETHSLDLNLIQVTIRDGVSNVFKNVQIISSVDKDRVFDLVSKFGDNMKSILIYDRVAQVGLISTFLTLSLDFLNPSILKGTELGNRHGILQK